MVIGTIIRPNPHQILVQIAHLQSRDFPAPEAETERKDPEHARMGFERRTGKNMDQTIGGSAHDALKLQVFDASGKLLGTLVNFSHLDAASGYRQYSASVNVCIGKSATVRFIERDDPSVRSPSCWAMAP